MFIKISYGQPIKIIIKKNISSYNASHDTRKKKNTLHA